MIIAGVLALIVFLSLKDLYPVEEISWQRFERQMLLAGAVEKVLIVNNNEARVFIKAKFSNDARFRNAFRTGPLALNKLNPGPHYRFTIGSPDSFERKLDLAQAALKADERIEVKYSAERNLWMDVLPWLFPLILLFFLFRMYGSVAQGGAGTSGAGPSIFSFGKSTARLIEEGNKSPVTFADVAGLEEAKLEVREICDFLKDPARYTKLGARIPKGIMIVGPPGTGKTLLARAVAGEARVPFFTLSGSEFVEMFVGVGASRVRDLFRRAKEKAPCIVFIDEIDAVGRSRGRNSLYTGANDERESTLNQLLTEMDGFGTNSGVMVLAATNRADVLDPALLRPGRFDRHIYLELPSMLERKSIFNVHLKNIHIAADVDVDFLAGQTPGFSGADIANICNEAALIAARISKVKVDKKDFMDALDRVVAGLEKKSRIISSHEKKIIAFHEAGHAVVSWFLTHTDPLLKVSVIPRGKTLGAAWYLPAERQIRTQTELTERLSALLAGRAAEELIFGEFSSGALDDLEKVTREAYMMVVYYGFNPKLGHVSYFDSTGRQDNLIQKPYSDETARLMDEEVRSVLQQAFKRSKDILISHRSQLEQLAESLLAHEVVYQQELQQILGKREVLEEPVRLSAYVQV